MHMKLKIIAKKDTSHLHINSKLLHIFPIMTSYTVKSYFMQTLSLIFLILSGNMRRVLCLAITVVVVVAAVITDAVSQNQEGELEVVMEPEEDQDGELTMTDGSAAGESTDKVFIPTDEWQTLEPGNSFYIVVMP